MVVSNRRRKTIWKEPQFVQAGVAQWHSPGRFVLLQQQHTSLQAELPSTAEPSTWSGAVPVCGGGFLKASIVLK